MTNNKMNELVTQIKRYAPYAKINVPKDQMKLINWELEKRLELANVSVNEITDSTVLGILKHFGVAA